VESASVPDGASPFDALIQVCSRRPGGSRTGLLLFLPLEYYTLHCAHYPVSLRDELERVLEYDRGENVFLDEERCATLCGDPADDGAMLAVPIYAMLNETLDKARQAAQAHGFSAWTVIPDGLGLRGSGILNGSGGCFHIALSGGKGVEEVELYRFHSGVPVEAARMAPCSALKHVEPRLAASEGNGRSSLGIMTEDGDGQPSLAGFQKVRPVPLSEPLLATWTRGQLGSGRIRGFGDEVDVRPLRIPKDFLVCLVLVAAFLAVGFFHAFTSEGLRQRNAHHESARKRLEAMAEPLLEMQERMDRLQDVEDVERKHAQRGFSTVALLRMLTDVTPDDTWVSVLQVRDDQNVVHLQGESSSTVRYMTILSAVRGFAKVDLTSPVRTSPGRNKEIFSIKIMVEPATLNELLSLSYGQDKEASDVRAREAT
ncbi:MAG TPA: PilN domain-containing protein, partial [Methanomassiliicoccales archaeon]|nr:PilN domain-containing protein [Methanomassiliicoccales archaeon]